MRTTPTSAQTNSLLMVLNGDHFERQRAIAVQRPELQPLLQDLVKANTNTKNLFQIMFSDLLRANAEMIKCPDDQFWRRATIRAFSATVEGMIFCLKQMAIAQGQLAGYKFTDNERMFLTESPLGNKKYKWPPFRDNVKETFKHFAKIFKIQCPIDFNTPGFEAFCQTYELRHRLIHPKNYMTFCVTDDERNRCKVGAEWLDTELKRLLTCCDATLV